MGLIISIIEYYHTEVADAVRYFELVWAELTAADAGALRLMQAHTPTTPLEFPYHSLPFPDHSPTIPRPLPYQCPTIPLPCFTNALPFP